MTTAISTTPLRLAAVAAIRALAMALLAAALFLPAASRAADRARIEAFLKTTGFDVALDSIALSAGDAPRLLGIDAGAFGSEWTRLTKEVFDTARMRGMALDILEKTLDPDDLAHAVEFYASDLGQRLVAAENDSHMIEDDEAKQEEGRRLVAEMVRTGSGRLELLKRMNKAIDSTGSSVRAIQEIQYRFMLAASAAGVIDLKVDPDELRAMLLRDEPRLRTALQESALAGAAYTYRDFSDADLEAYAEALEDPAMQRVYALLNAVQYEIMANRFEALATRMATLQPGQDI
ncbi:DUF2059 domain-containing protein [Jhaorihella thermophila]|uniref:DUF2059 domain-containing protein n=1 Tax=Jhaorihella thermophila TaxID=488547 RepID=A0A1H5W6U5_9RHOB|nr:hypothetical protein SAMN05421751_107131 [Jhaorihella thermophila]